jgi:hypothetical protein
VRRLLSAVLLLVASAFALAAQSSSIDQAKLALIRNMAPEERAKLKARLDQIKKLPDVERQRLRENLARIKAMPADEVRKLKEKATRLTPEDHRDYGELAGGFFRWAHRMGYVEGFPRGAFFAWMKKERPEKIQEIRLMDSGVGTPRVDAFMKLYHEFRDVTLARTEQHVQKHRCAEYEALHELRDASPREFWPKWAELMKSCDLRRAKPGPVAPRPVDRK